MMPIPAAYWPGCQRFLNLQRFLNNSILVGTLEEPKTTAVVFNLSIMMRALASIYSFHSRKRTINLSESQNFNGEKSHLYIRSFL